MPQCWTRRPAAVPAAVLPTGRCGRCRWSCLATAPALRLTALVLAAHTGARPEHSTDMDILTRLCGHSPQQTGELLDRLVTTRTLRAWHHNRETDAVSWQLPQPQARTPT
ncbi:hypothetical protein [Streptomyces deccanensis]|uniref:hypothetical protein n=1 Tax=Streptomyces deccanensis TaxID=424188 RepID=UPI001EFA2B5C|nr:hypothetical protein [Streptomyces deccanensis]ULR47821.1 hypothetical protein L3078_00125 [Streptomyces deccanensis]